MEGSVEQGQEPKSMLWDCGSTLYDSFELRSLKRQLDSAIASRSLSMPRLVEPVAVAPAPVPVSSPRKASKFSRSLSKLLRSMLRLKPATSASFQGYTRAELGFYSSVELDQGGLWTIPEVSEKGFESPEFDPVVRKTVSERFASSTVAARLGLECS
ncbi:hypothetical protein J5N97_028105 [Dioscorea zingiberensis]|uniref:Uncharacterized protein n=1 Tax=Dioscorea zingiberensis TaxID=325984 RepID=A0A9D5BYC4_9LILI|nr:hypothetical protein J5N97_028105 [Dioscorea zingiberensis]